MSNEGYKLIIVLMQQSIKVKIEALPDAASHFEYSVLIRCDI